MAPAAVAVVAAARRRRRRRTRRARRAQGTNVNMTAQLQYRRSDSDILNIMPELGGHSSNSSLAVPVSFNIRHKRDDARAQRQLLVDLGEHDQPIQRRQNVPAEAGITGVSTDPFDFGVPGAVVLRFQACAT